MCFTACGGEDENSFTVYVPDGAPAVAIAKFINDKENFGTEKDFEYNVVSAKEISGAITVKKADFVIMPVNTASLLYKESGGYKMAAVITHGNFYFVSSFAIESVEDLIGKCVLMPNNENTVPDLTLKSILKENDIEYFTADNKQTEEGKVAISYYSSGSLVIGNMPASGSDEYVAMLPEPAATAVTAKKSVYSHRLDVQAEYDKVNKSFPQAVLMVKESVANNHTDIVNAMANAFASNVQWVKSNPDKAVGAVKSVFDATTLTSLTEKSIEGCKIYWGGASYEKEAVNAYIAKIREISPDSANLVDDDFYL